MRFDGRQPDEKRPVSIEPDFRDREYARYLHGQR